MTAVIPSYKPDAEQLAVIMESEPMELGNILDSNTKALTQSMEDIDINL